MAWKEYNDENIPDEAKSVDTLAIIFGCFMIALLMYSLGRHDGLQDAIAEDLIKCATVENVEDG